MWSMNTTVCLFLSLNFLITFLISKMLFAEWLTITFEFFIFSIALVINSF